jgi:hypothetical protein
MSAFRNGGLGCDSIGEDDDCNDSEELISFNRRALLRSTTSATDKSNNDSVETFIVYSQVTNKEAQQQPHTQRKGRFSLSQKMNDPWMDWMPNLGMSFLV